MDRRRGDHVRLPGTSARRALKGAVFGLAVCLLATACGGDEEPEPERVTAAEQCDDTLSPEAARALEVVLGTEKFSHDPRGGLERSVDGLAEDYAKAERRPPSHSLCRASRPGVHEVAIGFRLYRDDDLLGDGRYAGIHPYDMGVEAHAGPERAYLFVRCVSPRLKGSDSRNARIKGTLTYNWSKLPDTVPVREATLTVLHSVTLAVVRKLGCENDAGLTEKPVFKPKPE
ncbi:hypothetical protein ACFQ8C_29400 [Streptomyces sp. NPDC056503]|uniref:hypothetical protein n=1 Tax=Streptomyces sp. NPDC056503 TaxID=3345842 RepID=UPI0036A14E7F